MELISQERIESDILTTSEKTEDRPLISQERIESRQLRPEMVG